MIDLYEIKPDSEPVLAVREDLLLMEELQLPGWII
jgi:hypothetical protein